VIAHQITGKQSKEQGLIPSRKQPLQQPPQEMRQTHHYCLQMVMDLQQTHNTVLEDGLDGPG